MELEGLEDLLREARDELYLLRASVAPLRNRAKDAVAALDRALERNEALTERIEALLDTPRPKEAQGEPRSTPSTEAHRELRSVG